MSYLLNGVALVVVGAMVCFVVIGPLRLMVGLVVGVRGSYRSIGLVGSLNGGLKRSLAAALPALATGALIAATISATGGINDKNGSFWVTVGFRAVITVLMVFGLLAVLAEPLRRLVMTLRTGVRERVAGLFRVAIALAVAAPIYSFINFRLSAPESIRLPLDDPIWGSFWLFAGLAGVAFALSIPIGRFRRNHLHTDAQVVIAPTAPVIAPRLPITPARVPLALRKPAPWDAPEPDEEFWSPEPMVGWRFWDWEGESLKGIWEAWPHSGHSAVCDACPEVPGWFHTCGIYALKDPSSLAGYGEREEAIVGRVELSGMVIEHDWGYRATSARIVELWVNHSITVVDSIRLRYPDVEVHWDSGWDEGSLVR